MSTSSANKAALVQSERPLFKRLVDRVFGFDFFVSYSWGDGWEYAEALTRELEALNFDVFLDRDDFYDGANWKSAGAWSLKRTSKLILVGTPGSLDSQPVQYEIQVFAETGRTVIPISIDGALSNLPEDHAFRRHIGDETLRIEEIDEQRLKGPSAATIGRIAQSFNILRQDEKRMRWLLALLALFAAIAAAAVWQGYLARVSEEEAKYQQGLAEKAEADAIDQKELAEEANLKAQNEAKNARIAEGEARIAEKEAEDRRVEAEVARDEAERQTRVAVSARNAEALARLEERKSTALTFANLALAEVESDPTLAIELAKRAQSFAPTTVAEVAALRAYNSGSMLRTMHLPDSSWAHFLGDGREFIAAQGRDAAIYSVDTQEVVRLVPNVVQVLALENGGLLAERRVSDSVSRVSFLNGNGLESANTALISRIDLQSCGGDSALITSEGEKKGAKQKSLIYFDGERFTPLGDEFSDLEISDCRGRLLFAIPRRPNVEPFVVADPNGNKWNLSLPVSNLVHKFDVSSDGRRVAAYIGHWTKVNDPGALAIYELPQDPIGNSISIEPTILRESDFKLSPCSERVTFCMGWRWVNGIGGLYFEGNETLVFAGESLRFTNATRLNLEDRTVETFLWDIERRIEFERSRIGAAGFILDDNNSRAVWIGYDEMFLGAIFSDEYSIFGSTYSDSRDGRLILTGSHDKGIFLWRRPFGVRTYRLDFEETYKNAEIGRLSPMASALNNQIQNWVRANPDDLEITDLPHGSVDFSNDFRVTVRYKEWTGALGSGIESMLSPGLVSTPSATPGETGPAAVAEAIGATVGGEVFGRSFVLSPRWILEEGTPWIEPHKTSGSSIAIEGMGEQN
ncbi:MAG: TIR domain-containing protein [Erythrobacter sp.]|uniref:TIR domain-containing protein n=1 Tax=Parasphingorhabdus sp. TaxID=2709688 RepID=UPI003273C88E